MSGSCMLPYSLHLQIEMFIPLMHNLRISKNLTKNTMALIRSRYLRYVKLLSVHSQFLRAVSIVTLTGTINPVRTSGPPFVRRVLKPNTIPRGFLIAVFTPQLQITSPILLFQSLSFPSVLGHSPLHFLYVYK